MTAGNTFKVALLAAGSAFLMGAPAGFAEDAASFAKFSTAAETSSLEVSYEPIAQFTKAFGDEQRGRVKIAYAAVEQQGEDFMKRYMRYLSAVPVSSLSRHDQLAYWLNTRNMLVMEAMSDSRSRRRMKTARGTPDAPGDMWTDKRIKVEGVELSIHDIEKNIILANFSDNPNVIFGLYQGTSGSPEFPKHGFSGLRLEAELEAAGREYVDSRNGLILNRSKAKVPAIYGWYAADVFGGDKAVARTHLAGLLSPGNAEQFKAATQFSTREFNYSSDELVLRQQGLPTGGAGGFAGAGGGGGGGGGGGS